MELANQVGARSLPAMQPRSGDELGASSPLGTGTGDVLTRKVNDTMDNATCIGHRRALDRLQRQSGVVLKYPGNSRFRLGINSDSDNLAHRLTNAGMQGPARPKSSRTCSKSTGMCAKVRHLVKLLDSIEEDGGTVLDNTVAFWTNECSDGCAHNLNNAPIIHSAAGAALQDGKNNRPPRSRSAPSRANARAQPRPVYRGHRHDGRRRQSRHRNGAAVR